MGILQWLSRPQVAEPLRQPAPHADIDLLEPEAMAEYRSVAEAIGVSAHALDIEEFRLFLAKHDLPIFNRREVVRYMDDIARKTNPTRLGWQWCPVRAKDAQIKVVFGTPSEVTEHTVTENGRAHTSTGGHPASDYYSDKTPPYARIIPLHALKKIALIEKTFKPDQVRFLVTDYVLHPHAIIRTQTVVPAPLPPPKINPDPFLMAVIPTADVRHGIGVFVIDVWDEPGFGLQQRLKPE